MTEAKTSCPKCSGHIAFPTELAGQEIACPHCGESVLLPKSRRATTWLVIGAVALIAVCAASILIWQSRQTEYSRLSLEILQKRAAKGDLKAQLALGWRYYKGNGVPTNKTEAVSWWTKAAEQGDAEAEFALGEQKYEMGWDYEFGSASVAQEKLQAAKCYREAFEWYLKSAQQGYANAQDAIAWDYEIGQGVAQDKAEAAKWYAKAFQSYNQAAKQGDKDAQCRLGELYLQGQGVEKNAKEAFKWLTKAAEQGNTEAMWWLAGMYKGGQGVKKNAKEAAKWYTKAAQQGHILAIFDLEFMHAEELDKEAETFCFNCLIKLAQQGYAGAQSAVAKVYDKGLGVATNKAEAVKWYIKAADQGEKRAIFSLKFMLAEELGTDAARLRFNWLLKAAEQGDAWAQFRLGGMFRDGDGVVKDPQKAVKWFLAAEQSYTKDRSKELAACAQIEVAKAYETGVGVLQDNQEAFNWYLKAACNGDKFAQFCVGHFYAQDLHSAQNRIEAHKWFSLAAVQGDEDSAKYRDIVAKAMTAQELAEAGRRAKAFVAGELPPTPPNP